MPRKSEGVVAQAQVPPPEDGTVTELGTELEMVQEGLVKEGSASKEREREKERESMSGGGVNVEDLNLPKSIVTRLAKGVLPPNTQIQGNAMLAMAKSATMFVNYLASHANEHTVAQSRKTIAPQDVFKALEEIEFPEFRARLEAELARYNEVQTDKRNTYRKKVADKAAELVGSEARDEDRTHANAHPPAPQRDGQPAAKKARREVGVGSASARPSGGRDGGEDGEEGQEEESMDEEMQEDEENGDGEGDDGEEAEDGEDGEGEGEDEDGGEDEGSDDLEPEQERGGPEDEALDNGEDSE